MHNFYFYQNWEADILAITKSRYTFEFEKKISKADFLNDFKKSKPIFSHYEMEERTLRGDVKQSVKRARYIKQTKHEWLQEGNGANKFYFIVPRNLVPQIEDLVPEFAGLMCFYEITLSWSEIPFLKIEKLKEAKMLHKNKISDNRLMDCLKSVYYKYYNT
jgi:hypothetical protein